MRILTLLLLLSIICLTASADIELIGCSCNCPEAPTDKFIGFNTKTIYTNGTNETNCQEYCGGMCGGMSHCGLNILSGNDCDTCCNTYCSGVTPPEAKPSCIKNCKEVCGVKSNLMGIASMFSYFAVAVVAVLFAVCGIRLLTADDPEAREVAKKCILYLLIALVLIGIAALIVALFTGITIGGLGGGAPGGAGSASILSGEFTGTC